MSTSYISISHLTYMLGNGHAVFQDLSLNLNTEKTGLIGKNGIGKSTLLKLMMGFVAPASGTVEKQGKLSYCPQEFSENLQQSIADLLGVNHKLKALARIERGSVDEADFAILAEDWLIRERILQQMVHFNLGYLDITRELSTLSGGERTRLLLARTFLTEANFIILDEPTNNLDGVSCEALYQSIINEERGLLIVSHDRALLNLMDRIIELTTKGLTIYGGNYDDYLKQKWLIQSALTQDMLDAKKYFKKVKSTIQGNQEKHARKKREGRKVFLSGSMDRITAGSKRGYSEKTQSRHVKSHDILLKSATDKIRDIKDKIEISEKIQVDLPLTYVPKDKVVVNVKNLSFAYPGQKNYLLNNFHFEILGPERIALTGDNGSGKTTLVKLLLQELHPQIGRIVIGVSHISYLDQSMSALEPETSLLDNYLRINPETTVMDAHAALARFLFRNVAAKKLVKSLSGGEKLRALLACVLLSNKPPQLLILDEPTNYLDLDSIHAIESALQNYLGTMIVISHDRKFLKNLRIDREINLKTERDNW